MEWADSSLMIGFRCELCSSRSTLIAIGTDDPALHFDVTQ
ncbi:hypothetical protein EV14_2761 [Prochlorococcus sp. MIT 0703]|nr:hypothetical protein EV12_2724 [Prochlorococcus sp. MIT 0701]KGG30824.1 hypothetical protein EV14_2761 [Prochlorococcus sp. MIT 0703]